MPIGRSEAAAEALVAFGVAGEDAEGGKDPGSFHVNLYDALYNLDPATLDSRASSKDEAARGRQDLETAKAAVEGGATVIQLRLKNAPTGQVVAVGGAFRDLLPAHRRQR